ncbi:TrmH family RNA methyltransferase [Nocardioides marmorisolisilvae]|uniref:RNA methyltransferase n=1 Tax=Nocardioides marmorisolisilvae TaxID=1542737 RepID=A0A3N0DV12_9ACTN|nr:RNA methyltransferase [Nocardioides marmorisolisilvae]RNL79253.1 RNA methyltransferase [Nocardioides marmorisolisilvae]
MVSPLAAGNARVKEARKLSRRSVRTERRLFLAEGWKAVAEAAAVPGCLVEVFVTADARTEHAALLDGLKVPVQLADDRAVASLSGAVSPQGLVAVCRFVDRPLEAALAGSLLVICADVRDPGNAGTIIRTADAVGADGVVLAGSSVDPYNDKTVRASVGSLFHLPLTTGVPVLEAVRAAQAAGYRVLAADGAGETDLFSAGELFDGPVAWLFGNEAWGLPEEIAAAADARVAIPILGRAESLNLSTAAAVCLYASAQVRGTVEG